MGTYPRVEEELWIGTDKDKASSQCPDRGYVGGWRMTIWMQSRIAQDGQRRYRRI
ncbi:hypothetical protein P692DRAFT_201797937 [Suillus brevipes Sb2]|nr:hypothetical protein P692DRAFT_201797937 [Suillus brevipes Sb2]